MGLRSAKPIIINVAVLWQVFNIVFRSLGGSRPPDPPVSGFLGINLDELHSVVGMSELEQQRNRIVVLGKAGHADDRLCTIGKSFQHGGLT